MLPSLQVATPFAIAAPAQPTVDATISLRESSTKSVAGSPSTQAHHSPQLPSSTPVAEPALHRNWPDAASYSQSPPSLRSAKLSAAPPRLTQRPRETHPSQQRPPPARRNSYKQTATACPRFIEGCRTSACCSIGIVSNQWQWLNSSLLSPVFSDPNSSATLPPSRLNSSPILLAASGKPYSGCCNAPLPHGRCPHNHSAIRNSFGHAAERRRARHDLRRVHRGPSCLERHSILIHHAQVPKSKIMHSPRHRPDIVRIAPPAPAPQRLDQTPVRSHS